MHRQTVRYALLVALIVAGAFIWQSLGAPTISYDLSNTRDVTAIHWPKSNHEVWLHLEPNGRVRVRFPGGKVFDEPNVDAIDVQRTDDGTRIHTITFALRKMDHDAAELIVKRLADEWNLPLKPLGGPELLILVPGRVPLAIDVVYSFDTNLPYGVNFEVCFEDITPIRSKNLSSTP